MDVSLGLREPRAYLHHCRIGADSANSVFRDRMLGIYGQTTMLDLIWIH